MRIIAHFFLFILGMNISGHPLIIYYNSVIMSWFTFGLKLRKRVNEKFFEEVLKLNIFLLKLLKNDS